MTYELSATLEGERACLSVFPNDERVFDLLREAGLSGVVQITEVMVPRPELIYRYANSNLTAERMNEEKQKALNRLLSVGETALIRSETVPAVLSTEPEHINHHRLHDRIVRAQKVFTFLKVHEV
jgi:hypothetical protein